MTDRPVVRISDLATERKGIECPACGCRDSRVRRTERENGFVQRKRICRNCGHDIPTREIPMG